MIITSSSLSKNSVANRLWAVIEVATCHFEVLQKHKATASIAKSGLWWALAGRGIKNIRNAVAN
jgi:hypothetical protein